ncbi:MAG: metallopeptidase [Euryarchaeota archaeon]|nr:metallopeptidase [Euryarchaeota archaeon]
MGLRFEPAPDIHARLEEILLGLELGHVDPVRIFCMRSTGSKARIYARIYALPKIQQIAFALPPAYVIEFLSEKFDSLPQEEKDQTIIHELLHIPRTFSGAIVPHRHAGRRIDRRTVGSLYRQLMIKGGLKKAGAATARLI